MTGALFVIDTTRCIGCKACQIACQQWNSLTAEDTAFTGSYQNPPDLSGANLNVVKFSEAEVSGQLRWLFFKDQCRHCENAWCKLSCPNYAIDKLPSGIVKIDPVRCDPTTCTSLSTKPCQSVCPFNVPKYQYVKNGGTVSAKMIKCHLCFNRLGNSALPAASRKPACMVTCPNQIMGGGASYDAIWTKVVNYVKSLRSSGKFPNATVYPHQTAAWGPTHVIWILAEDWRLYNLPAGTYGYL
jgi:formate dehydrogenase iron-sulfur subunit